jgi:hypothetical protein
VDELILLQSGRRAVGHVFLKADVDVIVLALGRLEFIFGVTFVHNGCSLKWLGQSYQWVR